MDEPTEELSTVDLPSGYRLRDARAADREAIVALCAAVFSPADGRAAGRMFDAHATGAGRWLVVTHDDRVVACSTLYDPQPLRVGPVEVNLGQIEYVLTDAAHRRRGLTRAQFAVHHQRSEDRGDLVQLVSGIPYLYRRLGYGYGLDIGPRYLLARSWFVAAPEVVVADAVDGDVAAIAALDRTHRERADLALERDEEAWRWLVAHGTEWGDSVLVARREGRVVAWARIADHEAESRVEILESGAQDETALATLLGAAVDRAGGQAVWYRTRPGGPVPGAVTTLGRRARDFEAMYARIPDPVAYLDAIRPALSARLAASPPPDPPAHVDLSLYDAGARLHLGAGEVTAVESIEPRLDPLDDLEAGVAPDAFPALALGRFAPEVLEERYDDVDLGRHRAVLRILFPELAADVMPLV